MTPKLVEGFRASFEASAGVALNRSLGQSSPKLEGFCETLQDIPTEGLNLRFAEQLEGIADTIEAVTRRLLGMSVASLEAPFCVAACCIFMRNCVRLESSLMFTVSSFWPPKKDLDKKGLDDPKPLSTSMFKCARI
jgi:hypothetical protein